MSKKGGSMGELANLGLDEEKLTEDAKKLMENKKWLDENYDNIKEEYDNKYVAVENKNIIDSDKNFHILIKRLKKVKNNINHIIIEPISSEDIILLL